MRPVVHPAQKTRAIDEVAPHAVPYDDLIAAERPVIIRGLVRDWPLARIGSPEDIARAVHFLACAPYVTGQIVAVDGGRSIFI